MSYALCPMTNLFTDLEQLHQLYPTQACTLNGRRWEYICAGDAEQLLLLLPGSLAAADAALREILHFRQRYTVLAVTYPDNVFSLRDLLTDLVILVQQHTRKPIFVIGGSYSGMTAQALVRWYPELIGKLILSDVGVPRRIRSRAMGGIVPLLRYLPLALLRKMWVFGMSQFSRGIDEHQDFWREFFQARVLSLGRAEWLAHVAMWRDFDRQQWQAFHFGGAMLIFETMHDQIFRYAEQRRLRDLYPQAQIYTFTDVSHSASLKNYSKYIRLVEQFLEAKNA